MPQLGVHFERNSTLVFQQNTNSDEIISRLEGMAINAIVCQHVRLEHIYLEVTPPIIEKSHS